MDSLDGVATENQFKASWELAVRWRDEAKKALQGGKHRRGKGDEQEELSPGLTTIKEPQPLCPKAIALKQYEQYT